MEKVIAMIIGSIGLAMLTWTVVSWVTSNIKRELRGLEKRLYLSSKQRDLESLKMLIAVTNEIKQEEKEENNNEKDRENNKGR